ncbi:MAG TPA: glycosyltransferase family 4 protein [Anaerolineaceae bacterium]|jgi:glycosyltransferase involved in cell wall biosynthesis|nr:glycosyltransferase family 4 protein [Anaerolineaceae bacterium]
MRIGILDYRMDYYTIKRIILNKVPGFDYVPVKDLYSISRRVALRFNRLFEKTLFSTFNLNNQFEDFDLNKVDVLHFSNGISYGKTPWVSQFETILPRFDYLLQRDKPAVVKNKRSQALTQRGLEALAGDACKAIIAWSENAAKNQRNLLSEFPSEIAEAILSKMIVLAPPQDALVDEVTVRTYSKENPIRFILVGAGFFRKGGREILNSFEKLVKEEELPVKLVLVSRLHRDYYAAHETEADIAWAKEKIQANPDWIEHYEVIPNQQVLELLKTCDVGLLPTYADTYGFSALEAQSAACPVISTDVRALPEINNTEVGWLINVPKNELGEAYYQTPEDRQVLSERIQSGLEHIIRGIAQEPNIIAKKGQAALEKIKAQHDPVRYGEALREIYEKAVA